MYQKTILNLKKILDDSLQPIKQYQECALLDYPDYLNLGDHLIWLGTIFYLINTLNIKINYCVSRENFSPIDMESRINKAPIFLHGGGNLGDLWTKHQEFKEYIISNYHQHPIVILPQSIYFQNQDNLKKTAQIFNNHPNLTIFVRDNYSYDIATNAFDNCQVFKAPDLALEMINSLNLSSPKISQSDTILYLCRNDREINKNFNPDQLNISNLLVEDWPSFSWKLGVKQGKIGRALANIYREEWQRGLKTPKEWLARQKWFYSHPYTAQLKSVNDSDLHLRSWSFIHSAIYQFQQHKLVISNRLHGHILCILLRKPHIFLPNAYHKNEQFYQTWTSDIPFCRFIKDVEQIPLAVSELLS